MKKLAFATVFFALATLAWGDAKSSAQTSTPVLWASVNAPVNPTTNSITYTSPWITVSSTQIQPPGGKDLLITFSAQTTVEVYTTNSNIGTTPNSATPTWTQPYNGLYVRILVDGVPAAPGVVTYDSQFRIMDYFTANPVLGCNEIDPSGVVHCTFWDQFYADVFSTSGVRSFSFVMRGVSPKNHVVEAQVQFSLSALVNPIAGYNEAYALAAMGSRTLVVEQVQLDQ